jgi:hypothetical protein
VKLLPSVCIAVSTWCLIGIHQIIAATATLPYKVIDKRTLTALQGARICIEQVKGCVESDREGYGAFTDVLPGTYALDASAAGYDTLHLENILIKTGVNTPLTIELSRSMKIYELNRMIIQSTRATSKQPEQSTSLTRLSPYELANTAGTANDITRVIATLPSVVSQGTDMENTLYVRGGHSRENTYLVDGIELDNISHFSDISTSGGGMGYINSSVISALDFYAGGIPALYPPAISSVVDMQMREGSFTDYKHQLDLNISGLGLVTEGPILKDRLSYLFGIRYLNLTFIDRFLPLEGLPQFGDSQLKLAYKLNNRHTLTLTGIGGFDTYNEYDDTTDWPFPTNYTEKLMQGAIGVAWNLKTDKFRNRLMGSFRLRNRSYTEEMAQYEGPETLYEEHGKYEKTSPDDTAFGPADHMYSYHEEYVKKELSGSYDNRWYATLKDDFVWYVGDHDQFNVGLSGNIVSYHLGQRSSRQSHYVEYWHPDTADLAVVDSQTFIDTPFVADSVVNDSSAGVYAQYVFNRGPLKIIGGVRLDYFRLLRDYGFSPRCALVFNPGVVGTFSFSGGLLYQLPADLSGSLYTIMALEPNSRTPPLDFAQIELQRNWQAAVGYEKELPQSHTIKFEAYYKWYDREYEMVRPGYFAYLQAMNSAAANNTPFHLDPPKGRKKAYGFELLLQKQQQKGLFYALGYSLFSVKDRYSDGKWYNNANNLQNTLGLTLGTRFLTHHGISVRLSAAQGRPYCKILPAEHGSVTFDSTAGYYTERLDPTLSANVRYSFILFPQWGTVTGYVEVWNVINYTPVIRREMGWNGYRDTRSNGIIPLVGISCEF